MHIGFSGFVLDGGKSGIATYVIQLLKHLQKMDKQDEIDVFLKKQDVPLVEFFNPKFHPVIYQNFIANPILNVLWHHGVLPITTKKKGYDLIHIPTIRRIPYLKGCKLVATIHDLAPLVIPQKYDPLRLFYHRHILSRCVHRCDHIIAISSSTKADIIKWIGYPEDKISVIYSGIDTETYHPVEREKTQRELSVAYELTQPFFVYVSRLEHPGKNHVNLIRAFEEFKLRYHTEHQLILIGADWSGAEVIKQVAAASAVRHDIHFLGFLPKDDVALFYNACDLMIFPSLYEGFGFPVLEALACGAKVICSNTSSLKEISQGYLSTFNPNEPQAMMQSIVQALSNQPTDEEKQRLLAYARSYNWEDTARNVLEVYAKVTQD